MNIFCFDNSPLCANMYLVESEKGFVVVDPCCDPLFVEKELNSDRFAKYLINGSSDTLSFSLDKVTAIVATHGHFDHISFVDEWHKYTGKKLYIHPSDAECISSASYNCSFDFGMPVSYSAPTEDIANLNSIVDVEILHTPGHSKGSCVLIFDSNLYFTGDTLFAGSAGRTDLKGGNAMELEMSLIKLKNLFVSDASIVIYPGHGPESNATTEIQYNPFLRIT
ncbi:MAG: MBL fold metallo-hydrolase [Clostridia bacterium]|nr:MBL fold metallo-hydrolase [Clostridia bacterium]